MQRGKAAENRKALFDVAIEEELEAGIVLTSDEIKSIREGRVQLTGAYVKVMQGGGNRVPRVVIVGSHLSAAKDPDRSRPLLLHAAEVRHLADMLSRQGKTAVPLRIILKRGWAKVVIGIGTGRKKRDKRQLIKERDLDREARRSLL